MTTVNVQTVVIVVAMEQEAAPFIKQHSLIPDDDASSQNTFLPGAPFRAFSGTVGEGLRVHLVWTGRDMRYSCNNVATTAASVASTLASTATTAASTVSILVSSASAVSLFSWAASAEAVLMKKRGLGTGGQGAMFAVWSRVQTPEGVG